VECEEHDWNAKGSDRINRSPMILLAGSPHTQRLSCIPAISSTATATSIANVFLVWALPMGLLPLIRARNLHPSLDFPLRILSVRSAIEPGIFSSVALGGELRVWRFCSAVKNANYREVRRGLWVLLVATHGYGVPEPIRTSPITYTSRVPSYQIVRITPCLFLDPRCLLISKVSPTRYPSKSQLGV